MSKNKIMIEALQFILEELSETNLDDDKKEKIEFFINELNSIESIEDEENFENNEELEDEEEFTEITSSDMSDILAASQNYIPWGDLTFKKMEPGLKKLGVEIKEGAGHYKLDRKLENGKLKTISIPRNEVNTKTALRILDDLDIDKKEYFTRYYGKPSKEQKTQMKKEKINK